MNMNRREFLKTTAAGTLLGSSLLLQSQPAMAIKKKKLRYGILSNNSFANWSGNVRMTPQQIFSPQRLEELQEIIARSEQIRAVGSGHSVSGIVPSQQTLVNTNALKGIIALDKDRQRVKVFAGTKLLDFSNRLAELGYALPSTGDTFYQSLAGLLSTGTHGTGMKWGSCSDEECLVGMEIITADGQVLKLDQDNPADHEILRAARVGLGSLGIVVSVTLKIVPVHNLEHVGMKLTPSEAVDPAHLRENDHYEFAYFPFSDLCYAFRRNITDKPRLSKAISRWARERVAENALGDALLKAASIGPSTIPDITSTFAKLYPDSHDIDRCDHVMTTPREVPAYLMEYALPIEKAAQAMEHFKELALDFAQRPKPQRFFINLPAQVRFVRADRGTLLSPGQGRDTCWFGIGSHHSFKGYEPFFQEFETRMVTLGGRPHWGKLFYVNPTEQYEGFEEFMRIRQQLDPQGKFSNSYIQRLQLRVAQPSFVHF